MAKRYIGNSRREDELAPEERRFCALRARGYSQTAAYREAYNRPRQNAHTASSHASNIARRPRVVAYLKSLFREAKKLDLISHAEYVDNLMADHAAAKAADNCTAAANFQRLIGQAIGSLSDTMVIEERTDPEVLLARLEGTLDATAIEQLRRALSAKDTFH